MHPFRRALLTALLLGFGTFAPAWAQSPDAASGAAPAPSTVLAFGDSLISGYGLPPAEGFAPQLEAALKARGHSVRVINGGVAGDTSAGALARLDWSLAEQPQVVVMTIGANDALRALPVADLERNLDRILARIQADGARIVLMGMMAPRNTGLAYSEAFDRLYPAAARKHGVAFDPFFLEGVATVPALNQGDGIHPNAAGVRRIVERVVPLVEQALGKPHG